jgi:hypothetical protein
MSGNLFLANTPLIALESAGLARHVRSAQLVLSADFDLAPRLAALLERWPDNPFAAIHLLPGRQTEHERGATHGRRGLAGLLHRVRVKRELRTQTLATLARIDADFQPGAVWIGNDRKVETQYALHLASERVGRRVGQYIDDGLHTYLGRARVRPWARRKDLVVKRLTYGGWWHNTSQSGTTPWIATQWLAFPDEGVDQAPGRGRESLQRAWFSGRPFLRLAVLAAREFGVDRTALRGCAAVLVLPHSNVLRANPGIGAALRAFVDDAAARGQSIAVKYHPREREPDPAGLLEGAGTLALPGALPMELLLPLLPPGALLAGEASTALLAARWLRPDLRVLDLGLGRGDYLERSRAFLGRHGIASLGGDLAALGYHAGHGAGRSDLPGDHG